MKKIIERWLLSFDNKDETGFDYKKLTSFWGILASTFLLVAYCVKEIKFYWIGVSIVVKDDLPEFKWVLGMVLAFILTLVYFTNSKTLTEFITKIKFNKKEEDAEPEK